MDKASEIYTMNAEAAAARCRELLTTAIPPPSGTALNLRDNQPPSEIVNTGTRPYRRRMWNRVDVDRWCAQRQPPRMRKAFACLAALEAWKLTAGMPAGSVADEILHDVFAEILAAGDEP